MIWLMMKCCAHCENYKPATSKYFGHHKHQEDKFQRYCLTCTRFFSGRWNKENAERKAEIDSRHRMAKLGIEGKHTLKDRKALARLQGGICCYCGKVRKLAHDHIMPVQPQEGQPKGTDWIWNIAMACGSCNSSKYNNPPLEWMKAKPKRLKCFIEIRLPIGGKFQVDKSFAQWIRQELGV